MKELELLERVRPDVRPLDEPERAAMRVGLFGTMSDTPEDQSVSAASSVALTDSPSRPRRTARQTVLVAAAVVLVGVSGAWGLLARRTNPPSDQRPASTTVATTIASPADATAQLEPTQAYWAAVWAAREIVIGQCMAKSGYEYLPRPFDSDPSAKQDEWQAWFDQQVANDPTFKTTMLGDGNQQAGGCQLEAFTAVHGPGEEAYSKMATLFNEMLADLPTDEERTTANITAWINDHRTQVEEVRTELDEEQATAESIINTAGG